MSKFSLDLNNISLLVVIFLSFIGTFVTVIFLFSFYGFYGNNVYEYQVFHQDFKRNSDYFGYASLDSIINEKNDYLSYINNDGENILSSNFGKREYECLGTCYCEDSKRRRTSLNAVNRGISFFLVSISSVVAYEKAKSFFKSKCNEELSEKCHHQSSIKSDVEKCTPITKKSSRTKYTGIEGEDDERLVFSCYGNCVQNLKIRRETAIAQFKHFQCEQFKQEGSVTIFLSELEYPSDQWEFSSTPKLLTARNSLAKKRFQEEYLIEWCKKSTRMVYQKEFTQTNKNGKTYPMRQKKVSSGCVGASNYFSKGKSKRESHLKNVRCRQIIPEPTNLNWKWRLKKWNFEKEEWKNS